MLNRKYFAACIMSGLVMASCTKETNYDVKGDTETKFFTNITSPGNAPQNSLNYSLVNIPNTAGSGLVNLSSTLPANIQFPVLATKATTADATISAVLDTSLISAYNAAHNTNYLPFPAGILKTDGLLAHIAKGNTMSTDSITIPTDPANLGAMTGVAYMAPIKLTTLSNNSAGKITDNTTTQITYVVANVEQRRIKYLATTSDVIGALITPRTSWVASFSPALTTTGSVTDASLTTYSRWSASPGQIDVDMQASKNVTGIRLYTANSATYVPSQIGVYLSNDGINYDYIGAPLKANLTYASSYNYILFYQAIQARYVRLKLSYPTSTNTQNYRVVEFDVYAQ
ncbi:discoidin domain-containing protein [Pinibacter soli]|uniref:Discoidin domain-containing protein n=1 Tax=Pinibacter soli TaxID=3044211 RepID=A0ABT6R6Q3_9BACT|nr:discoidin domain-containing protein [Pinibacter soli]MDI3318133.1 discoidin domain-containing protein [Pinibacter soli]